MSRRRKSKSNNNGSNLVAVMVTAFVILVFIGSILLFLAWMYFERKCKSLIKATSTRDFDNTPREVKEINELDIQLKTVLRKIDALRLDGAGVQVRGDGKYSERSAKGKMLNRQLAELEPKADKLDDRLDYLLGLPEKRLSKWLFEHAVKVSLRVGIAIYLLTFGLLVLVKPLWVVQLSGYLRQFGLLDFYASYPIAYGASTGALLISMTFVLGTFFFYRSEKRQKLENASHEQFYTAIMAKDHPKFDAMFSVVSHAELKKIVDFLQLKTDKRSRQSIIESLGRLSIEELSDGITRYKHQTEK